MVTPFTDNLIENGREANQSPSLIGPSLINDISAEYMQSGVVTTKFPPELADWNECYAPPNAWAADDIVASDKSVIFGGVEHVGELGEQSFVRMSHFGKG